MPESPYSSTSPVGQESGWVGWKVYIDGILEEKQRALDAALIAQKEAVTKAESATERIAARAIADQEALREEMGERLAALRRELEAATDAQKEAVLKAEEATEKRFESVNEWRDQSADRERSQIQERATLTAQFVLKEVSDARLAALDVRVQSEHDRVSRIEAAASGAHNARNASGTSWDRAVSTAALMVAVVLAVIVAIHGG